MKRILNRRPFLFLAFALLSGVAVGGVSASSLLMKILIPIASVAIGIFLWLITKKKITFVLCTVFAIGIALFAIDNVLYAMDMTGEREMTMRVEQVREDSGSVVLSAEGYRGYALLYNREGRLQEGDVVVVSGRFEKVGLDLESSFGRYLYAKKIGCKIDADNVKVVGHEDDLFLRIRNKARKVMSKYMTEEDVGIGMSLVFGDKTILTGEVKHDMAGAGLSHVLAVSGLHVGFFTAVLLFLLKKMGIKKVPQFIITTGVLCLYGLLTGFPSGVKRSIITYAIYAFAPIVRRKSDNLNTLSAAAFLIVLTNPREILDIGFLMSAGAVLGMVLFYKPLYRIFTRKVYFSPLRYLIGIVSATLSANVFILPLSFSVFGNFTPYAVIGNALVLPILTATFPCIVISSFLSVVYSGFGFLFYVFKYPIIAIRVISSFISSLLGSQISISGLGWAVVTYSLFFLFLSRFIRIKPKPRLAFLGSFGVATVLLLLL